MRAIVHFVGDDGSETWKEDGRFHREDGPAVIYPSGTMIWYRHGQLHCESGPAWCWMNGNLEWWLYGINYTAAEWMWLVRLLKPSCNG
jgi:hypothetical protein